MALTPEMLIERLLAFIYYVALTPIASVFRLIGRDVIGKKFDPSAKLYYG